MVPIIISHDGAVHKDTVRRWKDIARDIKVDWVRMAQNVLRYNVVIVGKFFNKGSWVSETWRKENPEEECDDEREGAQKESQQVEKEMKCCVNHESESVVCVRPSGTPPPCAVRPTSAGTGNTTRHDARTNQPII